ncbi:hypothetical protein CaCOL14_012316 [Colletotrichum acutatum]
MVRDCKLGARLRRSRRTSLGSAGLLDSRLSGVRHSSPHFTHPKASPDQIQALSVSRTGKYRDVPAGSRGRLQRSGSPTQPISPTRRFSDVMLGQWVRASWTSSKDLKSALLGLWWDGGMVTLSSELEGQVTGFAGEAIPAQMRNEVRVCVGNMMALVTVSMALLAQRCSL